MTEEKKEQKSPEIEEKKEKDPAEKSCDMTGVEMSCFKDAFSLFDTKGDGTILVSELGTILGSLMYKNVTQNIIAELHHIDGTGTIEFDEFIMVLSEQAKFIDAERQANIEVLLLDEKSNQDKVKPFLSLSDLRHVMSNLGEPLTKIEIEHFLVNVQDNTYQKHYNDEITREKFCELMATELYPEECIEHYTMDN